MGTQRTFRHLKDHATKLFRVKQEKALRILGYEISPRLFDDVQRGVCGSLVAVWLRLMMDEAEQGPAPPVDGRLFQRAGFKVLPMHYGMARYLTDAKVIQMHRGYADFIKGVSAFGVDRGVPRESAGFREMMFWRAQFAGMAVVTNKFFDNSVLDALKTARGGAQFAFPDLVDFALKTSELTSDSPYPGVGCDVGLTFKVKFKLRREPDLGPNVISGGRSPSDVTTVGGHAIGFFR